MRNPAPPGLGEFCARHAGDLAAGLLIASDGPRVAAGRPAVFPGSRGSAGFTLRVRLRERSCHPGNRGGLLRNPATVLASAVACLVDGQGRILVPGLRPPPLPATVRAASATGIRREHPGGAVTGRRKPRYPGQRHPRISAG